MEAEEKRSKGREKQETRETTEHIASLPPHHLMGHMHLYTAIFEENRNLKRSNIFIFKVS